AASQDPKIVQAFAEALKEIDSGKFEGFCSAVKDSVDIVLTEETQTPSDTMQDKIKHIAGLIGELGSMIEFSPSALALHSLAQKLPTDRITPDLIGFCNDFPEQAQALAERQDLQRTSFQATNYDDGMVIVCCDSHYKPEILNLIDAGLFEGEGREARIESFLKDTVVTDNQFFKDLHRGGVPHATLPNGVEILSNFGEKEDLVYGRERSEYREMTGKPFDKAEYLKYILDKFKEAYGNTDEAAKAFKVFVQNFSGSGNTVGNIMDRLAKEETTCPGDYFQRLAVVNEMFRCCLQQPTMRMDKNFNITLNINACLSGEKVNEINQHLVEGGDETINENIMIGATVSTYIPAVISDSMDQRGQHGKQTTTFGVIASFGNGDSK
ncbi:MAG: hypothetical protein LBK24_02705, partial [Puniceicoccales bacterium]|nr:hypothetical protein [Puniceicoccales bacterium]